ncbi:GNAT family N-acetyltransferase [Candidatus Fermentibacteria bacterium]|nr:GNAT family N-acetyltransferase [Candidatus Fermentibacteria bacterium]
MSELINALGELALASRLKRLSDRLMLDATRVYHDHGVDFEPRWFLLFYELHRSGPLAVTEVADRIGVTHPAVNQSASELVKRGLLRASADRRDRRRRLLDLTPSGKGLVAKLQPIWEETRQAAIELLHETGSDLLAHIERIEDALDRQSMYERVRHLLKDRQLRAVEIIGYHPELKGYFKSLNLEWIHEHFTPEATDLAVLDDPEQEIIGRGGLVLFARLEGEVVGTCAIVPWDSARCELIKMAVDTRYRGQQVGRRLTLAAIEEARKLGAHELTARTSPALEAANRLYRSLGFEFRGSDTSGDYTRRTVVFALRLNDSPEEE